MTKLFILGILDSSLNMTSVIDILNDFIDKAQRSRKYQPNVASNFKSPLKLLKSELTSEEENSLQLFKKNLDQIFNSIFTKGNKNISAISVEVYKRRIKSLISDYEQYGIDASKMASWDRKIIVRKSSEKRIDEIKKSSQQLPIYSSEQELSQDFLTVDVSLSNGKAKLIVPKEVSEQDAKKLKAQIDILANIYDNAE